MAKQTALITGASVGIGYELARQFARGGYDLLLAARNEEKLTAVAAEMRAMGVAAQYVVSDLARPDAPAALLAETARRGVSVDVLVNNAGFGAVGRFLENGLRNQLDMIQVNVAALVELTHLFTPGMVARGRGGVLNVASTAAYQPGPYMAVYYATKAFVLSFTEAVAEELRGSGVTVTALCPGPTHSEFGRRAKMDHSPAFRSRAIPVMTGEAVARAGYEGFARGRRVVVTGWLNKVGVQANRVTPRRWITKLAAKLNRGK